MMLAGINFEALTDDIGVGEWAEATDDWEVT